MGGKIIEESNILNVKSMRQRVFEYLEKVPNANIHQLYFEFPEYNHETLQVYKNQFKKENLKPIKAAMVIVFDILSNKCKLTVPLKRTDREAMNLLEVWCGYETYKEKLIIKAADKLGT